MRLFFQHGQRCISFNSLQTGKHIQRHNSGGQLSERILFQFPSNGKAYTKSVTWLTILPRLELFQFPSNGKAYTKASNGRLEPARIYKSFNSLQTGKHIQSMCYQYRSINKACLFQFPSNGKAYTKLYCSICRDTKIFNVSIPFKRESIYKVCGMSFDSETMIEVGFNSLQTGKHIQSKSTIRLNKGSLKWFQFPSNGKAYTKEGIYIRILKWTVSIPFKRESIYKADNSSDTREDANMCFNSLQTGKHIQRHTDRRAA